MWWILIGYLTGRGLRDASLPDSVKQARYAQAQARRATRHASPGPTFGQWVVLVLVVLTIVGLIIQAF